MRLLFISFLFILLVPLVFAQQSGYGDLAKDVSSLEKDLANIQKDLSQTDQRLNNVLDNLEKSKQNINDLLDQKSLVSDDAKELLDFRIRAEIDEMNQLANRATELQEQKKQLEQVANVRKQQLDNLKNQLKKLNPPVTKASKLLKEASLPNNLFSKLGSLFKKVAGPALGVVLSTPEIAEASQDAGAGNYANSFSKANEIVNPLDWALKIGQTIGDVFSKGLERTDSQSDFR